MFQGNIDKVRIAVPGLSISKGELRGFHDTMDEFRTARVHCLQVKPFQQRKLLEKDRTLAPGAALEDFIIAERQTHRSLVSGTPGSHVVHGQKPGMRPAGGIAYRRANEVRNRFRDEALVEHVDGRIDPRIPIGRSGGLVDHPLPGFTDRGIAQQ